MDAATLSTVRLGVFEDAAAAWDARIRAIREQGRALQGQVDTLATWTGTAAEAATGEMSGLRQRLTDSADHMDRVPAIVRRLGSRIGAAQRRLSSALGRAHDTFGIVVYPVADVRYLEPLPPDVDRRSLETEMNQIRWDIESAVADARSADTEESGALRQLLPGVVGLAPTPIWDYSVSAGDIPPPSTSPQQVNAWWNGLNPMQQESLLFTYSSEIGRLDGIPIIARDRANRAELAETEAFLRERQAMGDSRDGVAGAIRGIEAISARLDDVPAKDMPPGEQPAFLINFEAGFDQDGGPHLGRVVVSSGNPDTASHVATYVPGVGTGIDDAHRELQRSDWLAASARAAAGPGTNPAVISWLGYDAPQDPGAAISNDEAQHAVSGLSGFQEGLRTTHEGDASYNTVIGHSFGSTVAGMTAMNSDLHADQLVMIGSPGAAADDVSELGIPDGNVWAARMENDWIQYVANWHGTDPTAPWFGAQEFAVQDGSGGFLGGPIGSSAHSEYFDIGTESAANLGRLIVGAEPTR